MCRLTYIESFLNAEKLTHIMNKYFKIQSNVFYEIIINTTIYLENNHYNEYKKINNKNITRYSLCKLMHMRVSI